MPPWSSTKQRVQSYIVWNSSGVTCKDLIIIIIMLLIIILIIIIVVKLIII